MGRMFTRSDAARARPVVRPVNRQPPRKVPSSARWPCTPPPRSPAPRRQPTARAAPRRRRQRRVPRGRCAGLRASCGSAPTGGPRAAGRARGRAGGAACADQLVDDEPAGPGGRDDLQVLAQARLDLPVARDDGPLGARSASMREGPVRAFILAASSGGVSAQRNSWDFSANTRRARPRRGDALQQQLRVLAGEVGVLLRAGQRELGGEDGLVEHEPGVVVAAPGDVLGARRASRSRGTAGRAGGCRRRRATGCSGRPGCGCVSVQTGEWLVMPSG